MPDCNPMPKHCGQPTISLLDGFHFGNISGNLAVNSCLSYACKHRYTVAGFNNVDPTSFSLNKDTGDFSLKPSDPTKEWSFQFWVKSYDCTVACKGKTQFDPDGPATISGDPLITVEQILKVLKDLPTYAPEDVEDEDIYWEIDESEDTATLKIAL